MRLNKAKKDADLIDESSDNSQRVDLKRKGSSESESSDSEDRKQFEQRLDASLFNSEPSSVAHTIDNKRKKTIKVQ